MMQSVAIVHAKGLRGMKQMADTPSISSNVKATLTVGFNIG